MFTFRESFLNLFVYSMHIYSLSVLHFSYAFSIPVYLCTLVSSSVSRMCPEIVSSYSKIYIYETVRNLQSSFYKICTQNTLIVLGIPTKLCHDCLCLFVCICLCITFVAEYIDYVCLYLCTSCLAKILMIGVDGEIGKFLFLTFKYSLRQKEWRWDLKALVSCSSGESSVSF